MIRALRGLIARLISAEVRCQRDGRIAARKALRRVHAQLETLQTVYHQVRQALDATVSQRDEARAQAAHLAERVAELKTRVAELESQLALLRQQIPTQPLPIHQGAS